MSDKKKTVKKTSASKPPTKKEIWETLSKVNVNKYLVKKGKFDYLPWGDAWHMLMFHYPDASFKNHLNKDDYPCFYDPQGRGMVRVTVAIGGFEHSEDYMVTNYSNKVIQNPDPAQVNNCLKRALVKCMAYFGLGSYLYNQEDMTEEGEVMEVVDEEDRIALIEVITGFPDKSRVIDYVKAHGKKVVEDLNDSQLMDLVSKINNVNGSAK